MKTIARLASGIAAALGVVMLIPAAGSATVRVGGRSACSGGGDFSVTIGYDQTTQKPTVDHSSNSSCVEGGNTVSFTANLPSGWSWSATFPSQTVGSSVFTNSCTFGSGSGQSTSCTVVSPPSPGDYYYSITVTDANGTSHTLDPKVIIKGLGGKHHPKKATAPSPAPQQ